MFFSSLYSDCHYIIISSWAVPRELSPLSDAEIKKYIDSTNKANGALMSAYKIALDPVEWEAEMIESERNRQDQDTDELEEEEEEEEEAEESAKGSAAKRKRKPAADKKSASDTKRRKTEEKGKPGRKKVSFLSFSFVVLIIKHFSGFFGTSLFSISKAAVNTEPVSEEEPVQANANTKSQKPAKEGAKNVKG